MRSQSRLAQILLMGCVTMTATTVLAQIPAPPQPGTAPGSSYEELNVPKAVPVRPTTTESKATPGGAAAPGADEGLYLNAVDTDNRVLATLQR